MRVRGPIAVSAMVVAGLVTAGSAASIDRSQPAAPEPRLAANVASATPSGTVGLIPASPKPARSLRAASPDVGTPFAGALPVRDVAIPSVVGPLGIPEIVLAAYRNAELALAASDPNCGLSWNLLAGIGRIESGHANGGRTDAAGTTVTRILGPALNGSLAGNAVIGDSDSGALDGDNTHDRAVGPMQFIPSTWRTYASDGNADGVADPNNVFDAALSAGKYLCSGGLDLRDAAQEVRAVLRYNNSMAYAANVISWSVAYRTGGSPATVAISPDLVAPGTSPIDASSLLAADSRSAGIPGVEAATTTTTPGESSTTTVTTETMMTIPGLPPFPCGIFCPPPPPPLPTAFDDPSQTPTTSVTPTTTTTTTTTTHDDHHDDHYHAPAVVPATADPAAGHPAADRPVSARCATGGRW